ncbi:hypothetical protein C8J55DRAFT_564587 [Lentinula edodes]|uniref:Uncharacterized protein n=1 Tax=Lentinula lateritia TaxID=40482 RepID=A0A9W8ZXT9_9AGAR|nr:hypothetical protein C8J55DRAFT_564587 [Lentinula edodes]
MSSNSGSAVPTTRIKFPSFDLSTALEADHKARMAAEDAGELLDDGKVEYEDEEADKEARAEPVPAINSSPNRPSMSRNEKKYAKLTKRSRLKRAAEAVERVASRGVKPFVVELAKGALPIQLEDFNASSLPVSSSGWNANPCKKLSPGLQRVWKNLEALSTLSGLKLLRWDGQCVFCVFQLTESSQSSAEFLMGLREQHDGQWKLKLLLLLGIAVNPAPSPKHKNTAGVENLPPEQWDTATAMGGANHKTTKSLAEPTSMLCKSFFKTKQFGASQAFKIVRFFVSPAPSPVNTNGILPSSVQHLLSQELC